MYKTRKEAHEFDEHLKRVSHMQRRITEQVSVCLKSHCYVNYNIINITTYSLKRERKVQLIVSSLFPMYQGASLLLLCQL